MSDNKQDLIVKAILTQRAETGKTKLSVSNVALAAGISRQALYKYHDKLLPYIAGEKPVEELFADADEEELKDYSDLQNCAAFQKKIADLSLEIATLKDHHKQALQDEKHHLTTSLMIRDIELHDGQYTRSELQNKTIQLNNRIKDLKISEDKISKLQSENSILKRKLSESLQQNIGNSYKIKLDFKDASDAINLINQKSSDKTSGIIIFIDRWNYPFSAFFENDIREAGEYIYISAPLFTARERKKFLRKITTKAPVIAIVPHASEAKTKWFRHLHCSTISQEQFNKADTAWQPILLNEGFDQLLEFQVSDSIQGCNEP